MASAKVEGEPTYVLTLSKDEAETLRTVLNAIGGGSENTRRRFTNAIDDALISVGVQTLNSICKAGSVEFLS